MVSNESANRRGAEKREKDMAKHEHEGKHEKAGHGHEGVDGEPQEAKREVAAKPEPVVEPPVDTGAAPHVAMILSRLEALTDRTALRTVRAAVASRCAACGVVDEPPV